MTADAPPATHPVETWLDFAADIETFVTTPPMARAQAQVPAEFIQAGRLLFFQWGRSFRTFRAIRTLVHAGFSEDAMVLVRTLLEVYFEMAFVARHPETAVDFFDHGFRTTARDFQKMRQNPACPPEAYAPVAMQEAKAISRSANPDAGPKNAPKSRWHQKYSTVRKRAIAGDVSPLFYDVFYSFASRYVHGAGDWMAEFFDPPSEGSRISYHGDSGEAALAVSWSCMCLVEQLRILDGCLSLGIGSALNSVIQKKEEIIRAQTSSGSSTVGQS